MKIMKANAKRRARLWWFYRNLWHHPHMRMFDLWHFEAHITIPYHWKHGNYRALRRAVRRDIFTLVHDPLLWIEGKQPFCCKGSLDCWQTHLCEWMEFRARAWEDVASGWKEEEDKRKVFYYD